MNWTDLLVIAIIGGFAFVGFKNGFLMSVYRLGSFFLSILLSIKLYPVMAKFLVKTSLYTGIKGSIYKNLMLQQQAQAPSVDAGAKNAAADQIIQNLKLPGFLKDTIVKQLPDVSKLVDVSQIMDSISAQLARLVVDVISLIAIYLLVRVGLYLGRFVIQGVASLPLFKQVDKLGGAALGGLEGLLTVYIVFAVLMLFHTAPQFQSFFKSVDVSLIAKFFYENNFIIDWMFPKGAKL